MPETAEQKASRKTIQERRASLIKTLKKAGKAYTTLNNKLRTDEISSADEKKKQKQDLIRVYSAELDEFISYSSGHDYGVTDSLEISIIVRDYMEMLKGDVATDTPDSVSSGLQDYVTLSYGEKNDDEATADMDKNVGSAQLSGLREIAKWMYRNSDHTGALSLKGSQERFVRHILLLPARVKLFMYYLVENKKRHKPEPSDLIQSQTVYVPDLNKFKEQMIASKFKFWKRADGSYVYWEKLEQALQVARPNMGILSKFGALGPMDSLDRVADKPAQTVGKSGAGTASGSSEADKAAKEREVALMSFMALAGTHRDLLRDKESGKDVKAGEIQLSAQTLEAAFHQLVEKDKAVPAIKLQASELDEQEETSEKVEGYTDMAGDYTEYGGKLNKISEGTEKIGWKLADLHVKNLNLSSGIFTTVAGVTSFAAAMIGIYNLAKGAGPMSPAELSVKISETLISLSEIAGTLVEGAFGIKNAAVVGAAALSSAGSAALAQAEMAGGVSSAVTGGLNFIEGMVKVAKAEDEQQLALDARSQLMADKSVSTEDKGKIEDITRLNSRINESRASSGALQMLAGGMQLAGGIFTAAGVTAAIGTVFSTIGSLINLADSVKTWFDKKKNTEMTIDTYIKMDTLWLIVRDGLIATQTEKALSDNASTPEVKQREAARIANRILASEIQIRKQIRAETMAALGFARKESFYRHITMQYAQFIYDHAFFKDGKPVKENEANATNKQYAQMIKSFGLKPHFATEASQLPAPDVETIAGKMTI